MRKNYRKLPPFAEAKLSRIGTHVLVATVKNVSADELASGVFNHVGLSAANGQPIVREATMPSPQRGRYSKYNVEGQLIVRRDIPKYQKAITFDVPCFGNYSRMCTVTQYRMVYVREMLSPQNFAIGTEILALKNDGGCVVKFNIIGEFDQQSEHFNRELLFAVNLLFESVQSADVFPSSSSVEDFLGSVNVKWEILPAGERTDNIRLILSSFRNPDHNLKNRVNERYTFFETLNPRHLIRGSGGMDGYVGAEVSDDLVVFENMRDGNALYLLFASWRERSQQTKTDLLENGVQGRDYLRFIHSDGWEAKVFAEVNSRRHRQ
jgi:hypothetical protein